MRIRAAFESTVKKASRGIGNARQPVARTSDWSAPNTSPNDASQIFVLRRNDNVTRSAGHPA